MDNHDYSLSIFAICKKTISLGDKTDVNVGTILAFKLTSRGGVEGAPDQVHTVYAKRVAAA